MASAPSNDRPIAISSGELAALLGAELVGTPSVQITHIDSLERAVAGALSFIRSARFARDWAGSKASAALVSRDVPLAGISSELDDGPTIRYRGRIAESDAAY